jgi:hypothetical protein
VFVVLQVDGKGNFVEGAYTNAVCNEYKEPLKALAKRKAPECIRGAIRTGR